VQFAGYEIAFQKVSSHKGPNYQETEGDFQLSRGGRVVVAMTPSKRTYAAPPSTTSEAAIHVSWAGDFYLVMGDPASEGGAVAVRMYFNPLVRFIWVGGLIMFIGGAVSLADRRLRIGVPVRRATPTAATTATGGAS
jgi:cytochrome c-type biogenesis protein CcmF